MTIDIYNMLQKAPAKLLFDLLNVCRLQQIPTKPSHKQNAVETTEEESKEEENKEEEISFEQAGYDEEKHNNGVQASHSHQSSKVAPLLFAKEDKNAKRTLLELAGYFRAITYEKEMAKVQNFFQVKSQFDSLLSNMTSPERIEVNVIRLFSAFFYADTSDFESIVKCLKTILNFLKDPNYQRGGKVSEYLMQWRTAIRREKSDEVQKKIANLEEKVRLYEMAIALRQFCLDFISLQEGKLILLPGDLVVLSQSKCRNELDKETKKTIVHHISALYSPYATKGMIKATFDYLRRIYNRHVGCTVDIPTQKFFKQNVRQQKVTKKRKPKNSKKIKNSKKRKKISALENNKHSKSHTPVEYCFSFLSSLDKSVVAKLPHKYILAIVKNRVVRVHCLGAVVYHDGPTVKSSKLENLNERITECATEENESEKDKLITNLARDMLTEKLADDKKTEEEIEKQLGSVKIYLFDYLALGEEPPRKTSFDDFCQNWIEKGLFHNKKYEFDDIDDQLAKINKSMEGGDLLTYRDSVEELLLAVYPVLADCLVKVKFREFPAPPSLGFSTFNVIRQ